MTSPFAVPAHNNILILDTNIVLDLLLFQDPCALKFQSQLQIAQWRWIATQSMRDELEHVLVYPHLQPRMAFYGVSKAGLLDAFDAQVGLVETAPATPFHCRDTDDQKFIDLAVAHQATLFSKDKQVLKLRKRLSTVNATIRSPAA